MDPKELAAIQAAKQKQAADTAEVQRQHHQAQIDRHNAERSAVSEKIKKEILPYLNEVKQAGLKDFSFQPQMDLNSGEAVGLDIQVGDAHGSYSYRAGILSEQVFKGGRRDANMKANRRIELSELTKDRVGGLVRELIG